ncbi:MAG: helix-turn-helix domain-containing protein, partial [Planctomycetota bacterium]
LLLDFFLRELTERYGKQVVGFTRRARTALMSYEWPGNIRQLRNVVERMIVLDTDGLLDAADLPDEVAGLAPEESDDTAPAHGAGGGSDHLIGRPLSEVERFYAERALEITNGKREDAAKLLGIGERTLYRKLKEWDLN